MSPIGTIKTYPNNPRVAKAQIAAAYNGLEFNVENFDLQKDRTPEFLAKFPMGKVPVLESAEVNLTESSAIGYYAAALKEDSPILGKNAVDQALIFQWVLFSETEIATNTSQWLSPLFGRSPYLKPNVDAAANNLRRALGALNKVLLTKTYLVGHQVTYADIAVVTSLIPSFSVVLDKAARAEFKNVTRYVTTIAAQPNFKKFLGDVKLCETPLKYTPPKKEKKPAAPAKEAPKKEAAPKAAQADDAEEPAKPAPKPKSNSSWMPGSVDYKYNDELTLTFMSNNLIGGFYARLERAHKYAFGSMIVRGENNNNTISGYFVIRGQEVPFEIYDAADYGSYDFQKIEPAQYEEKKEEFYKYLAWEFDDCVDGKVFK
ncbi:elongation factor 1-gamma family protein [Mucor ambiguus]|uniref:Elongation factor 1-gamma family protein n=1 Tax=Mucor ambiguus TaxID=91626 RepID=A0A0C9LT62_9FUNG|nr:elongation factor 1-gamma family protein [Mucor ambiguus]